MLCRLSRHVVVLLGIVATAGCGADTTGPAAVTGVRLARLTEYLGTNNLLKQRGTYRYDEAGRFVHFDFERIEREVNSNETTVLRTLYSRQQYAGDRLTGGEAFARKEDEFVKSQRWAFTYDAAGRVTERTNTWLVDDLFRPINEVGTEEYRYDDADRVVEVIRDDGQRWVLDYDSEDNVSKETLFTTEGIVIYFDHTYDQGKNPFFDLARRQGGFTGIIVVVGPWALFHSPRNVIRTETRVEGRTEIVSIRTVEIESYNAEGYPLRSVQELRNTADPDGSVFTAEYEYEPAR